MRGEERLRAFCVPTHSLGSAPKESRISIVRFSAGRVRLDQFHNDLSFQTWGLGEWS